jgi:exonuclease III
MGPLRLWLLYITQVAMYNLISLNVNGLNDQIKRYALIDWLKCMKADIVCLQETHASCNSTIQSWFRNSGFRVVSSSTSNKRCGTAILVRDIYQITHICKDDDGRFSQVVRMCVLYRYTRRIRTRHVILSLPVFPTMLTWLPPPSSVVILMSF